MCGGGGWGQEFLMSFLSWLRKQNRSKIPSTPSIAHKLCPCLINPTSLGCRLKEGILTFPLVEGRAVWGEGLPDSGLCPLGGHFVLHCISWEVLYEAQEWRQWCLNRLLGFRAHWEAVKLYERCLRFCLLDAYLYPYFIKIFSFPFNLRLSILLGSFLPWNPCITSCRSLKVHC